MASYVKSTDFASKDALLSGDPAKIIKGTEIDSEYNAIAVAVSTKADTVSPTFTGAPTAPTAAPGTNSTQIATTAFVTAAVTTERSATATLTNKTLTSPVISTISNTGTLTLPTSTDTLVGRATTDTLTNKTLTSPVLTTPSVDVINEATSAAGVTIDGCLIKDGVAASAAQLSTSSGSAPSYSARAWVNFNGTGTVAIRSSGNVSSITDVGTGTYEVNFTTAMEDENYSVNVSATTNIGLGFSFINLDSTTQTSSKTYKIVTASSNSTPFDAPVVCVSIFR